MHAPRPLVLVGPMGAGKSCVGALLARRLGRTLVDVDACIEAAAGSPVAALFAAQGEPAFREREHAALVDALRGPATVIATGGGAVLDARNRTALAGCDVVHLHAGVDTQLRRLRDDSTRPLLAVADRATTLARLAAVRGPLYAAVAGVHVDTDDRAPAQVADAVMAALGLEEACT